MRIHVEDAAVVGACSTMSRWCSNRMLRAATSLLLLSAGKVK